MNEFEIITGKIFAATIFCVQLHSAKPLKNSMEFMVKVTVALKAYIKLSIYLYSYLFYFCNDEVHILGCCDVPK